MNPTSKQAPPRREVASESVAPIASIILRIGPRDFGLPVSPHVRAHHPKMAREDGHPFVESPGSAHCRVQQKQCLLRPPWIAVIVDRVAQFQAVARDMGMHY